jgi:hypothetical protein
MNSKKSVMLGKISAQELHGPWSDFMQKLQTEEGCVWFEGFKRFLRKEDPWSLFGEEQTVIVSRQGFDLRSFFESRQGLHIDRFFVGEANALLVRVNPPLNALLKYRDLSRNAYDREIKTSLPEYYKTELWTIAQMITAQEGGKGGALLNDGRANIFYVADFIVRVCWRADLGEWRVRHEYPGRWRTGTRVFYI